MMRNLNRFPLLALTLLTLGCATQRPAELAAPRPLTTPATVAVTTAHPLASAAALRMLDAGGSAVDAAIAAQMVLGAVEAQSSGIGGGALLLHFDAAAKKLTSFDGLSAAPARVTPALTVDVDGTLINSDLVQRGGRSIGVPGALTMLALAHARHGKLPWRTLFDPAITLAEAGVPMAAYMHGILSLPNAKSDHPELLSTHFTPEGTPRPIGTLIEQPVYAATLKRIGEQGPAAAWGTNGADFLAAAQRGAKPSLITARDLADYQALEREPICAPFLAYSVCMMAPPSFGGVVVLQMLQVLQTVSQNGTPLNFDDPAFAHAYVEAGRLAQADRLHYVGDPAFTRVPTEALLARDYLTGRAKLVSPTRMTPEFAPGNVLQKAALLNSTEASNSADATSQIAIVDAAGNALSVTTTNNLNFGARLVANGAVLNNAMTNFTGVPRAGIAAPNRMESGKRPVTSMAPTIVFDQAGAPIAVGGSAGGGQIVDYIAQSLIEMLANARTPAQALARGHISTAIRGKVQLEKDTAAATLADGLRAKGHTVEIVPMPSGLGFLRRTQSGWIGAADPRRDGVAIGR